MDVLMIVFIVLISLVLIVTNIYLLAYYCHPDDRGFGSALICKLVVVWKKIRFLIFYKVLGMSLSWAQVLMLPLDVSNMSGFGGGIDMKLFWFIVFILTGCFVLFIIPTLIYYYEADEEWTMVNFIMKLKSKFFVYPNNLFFTKFNFIILI